MRIAAPHGPRYALNCPTWRLTRATLPGQCRAITATTNPDYKTSQSGGQQTPYRPPVNSQAQSIGILGGGITGLATAWNLSRLLPNAKITVYEKKQRLGGWLDSEILEVDGGQVLFEWGPRSVRPDAGGSGRATLEMLNELGIIRDMIFTGKTKPAAVNRFIYFGGKLVRMPAPSKASPISSFIENMYKFLTEPIFKGVAGSVLAESLVKQRPINIADESVGDFIRRRFGKTAADNLASAVFHGIYAGDLYQLSARTLLPKLWHMEGRDPRGGGVLMEMADIAFRGQRLLPYSYVRYSEFLDLEKKVTSYNDRMLIGMIDTKASVYTFGLGLQHMSQSIQEKLKENENITFHVGQEVTELQFNPANKKTKVIAQVEEISQEHDYIVSSLSPRKLLEFATGSASARGTKISGRMEQALQESNKSVNVGVVNLYYSNPDLIPPDLQGFGYLIPQSVKVDENPERALGVIFGSESSGIRGKNAVITAPKVPRLGIEAQEQAQEQALSRMHELNSSGRATSAHQLESQQTNMPDQGETPEPSQAPYEDEMIRQGQDTAPGTKLTVMLGGHWWSDWAETDLPTPEHLIDMAQSLLARHLQITEPPTIAKARMNRDCIPQYTVGYRQRMATIHQGLMEEFQGRVKVAGPWWQGGVGVNDCVFSAHMTAFNIRGERDDETGLKNYTEPERWVLFDAKHASPIEEERS